MEKKFSIYFSDLNIEAQNRLLGKFGMVNRKEMNWDTFPLSSIIRDIPTTKEEKIEVIIKEVRENANMSTFLDLISDVLGDTIYEELSDRLQLFSPEEIDTLYKKYVK